MPRTGLSPEDMRQTALDAAEAIIRRHGIERTRVVDIARRIGVNHALLYRHFSDKAALVDAVSERWLQGMRDDLGKIVDAEADPAADLRQWFVTLYRLMREKRLADPELYRSFSQASDEQRPFVGSHIAQIRWQLAKLVTAAVRSGTIAERDPLEVTVLLYEATLAFHHPGAGTEAGGEDRMPVLQALLDVLIAGLRARPGSG